MSDNISIDEILRQAEEIRMKTAQKARDVITEINNTSEPLDQKNASKAGGQPADQEKTQIISDAPRKTDMQRAYAKQTENKTRQIYLKDESTPSSDKEKKSFFKEAHNEPVYSKEPPAFIERPATIKSKSRFDRTSDLQEIPTILAVEELDHTRIMGTIEQAPPAQSAQEESREYAQIKLSGFDDEIESVPTIDEDIAEQQLIQRRKEKVGKFRLFGPDDISKDGPVGGIINEEYQRESDKSEILERLFSQKANVQLSIILTTVFGFLLLLMTVLKDTKYLPSALLPHTTYFSVVLVLYVLVLLSNIKNIFHGFSFKRGINADFPAAFASFAVLLHTIGMLIFPDVYIESATLYPSAVTFALFMSSMGKRNFFICIIENFEFITSNREKYTVETIRNVVDATIISRGLLKGDPILKTSVKTDVPTNFLEIGCSDEPANRISAVSGLILLGFNFILMIIYGVVTGNWLSAVNIAVCGLCISLPCAALYASNAAFLGVSRVLAEQGSMVNGYEGAEMVSDANAIVIEASDLFRAKSCDLHGIKTFNGAKIDDAILQTAAVIIKTKGPLVHVFDDVIVGKQSILPEVDGVIYEERMGTSAWIYKKKILVGNRDLLIRHGVAVPKIEYEKKYTRKGRKALYLAVAGKIWAMFIVSYGADNNLKRALRKLEKSGITILVKSCDPNINEESLADLFSLPEGYIRVMHSSSGRVFEKYSDMYVEKSAAYVVHDGSALGFISAMRGAENLVVLKRLLSVLVSFGSAIGFGVVVLLAVIGGTHQLNVISVTLFQAVWSLLVIFISKLRKLGI